MLLIDGHSYKLKKLSDPLKLNEFTPYRVCFSYRDTASFEVFKKSKIMTLKRLSLLPLLSLCLFLYACPPPDDYVEDESSTVFNEESFVQLFTVNSNSVENVSFTDGVSSGNNVVDASSLGSAELKSFETGIAAPTDTSVDIEAGLQSVTIILDDGTEIPPFFASVSSNGTIDAGDGVIREDFRYRFTYPAEATPIPINTIGSMVLIYSLDYFSFYGLLHSKTFTHTIVFN